MVKRIRELKPPKEFSRLLFRIPILFFHIGLGWMFGKRFLLLSHTGRKSGLARQVVLEIPWYDKSTNTYYVNSGFGPTSSWYQNILKQPQNTIQVGNQKMKVLAQTVSPEIGALVMLNFAKENPFEAKFVKALGYKVDGTDADWQALGRELIIVSLKPTQ
jgi:deazaflavin-dependent oxidoreductase (nitroreductase family)